MARSIVCAAACLLVALFCLPAAAKEEKKSVTSMFKGKLFDAKGKEVAYDVLEGKIVGIYFCENSVGAKRLTRSLINVRNLNKEKFEVVFVSMDKTADDAMKHFKDMKMPWYYVEFDGEDSKSLKAKCKPIADQLPKLCIFSHSGHYASERGAGDLRTNESSAMSKWERKAKD